MSVWKRNENEFAPPPTNPSPAPPPVQSPAPPPPVAAARPAEPPRQPRVAATIGPSIAIKGDVTGEEDLIIEGRIEGKILLKANSVTIGRNGRVKANVYANSITVEGEVEGDLIGKDEVVIRQSGKVKGNVAAPRVVLDSGARFQGSIDMEAQQGRPVDAKVVEKPAEKPAPAPVAAPLKQAAIGTT
ncbi:MAG TPA: polymer-forming cytoskeletal protein [Thermoanaerobaculia bacterium]|jgi:cytoskeletal protein CcmA (bactofilin family)|nr:polymer-forming cytoskeletal protein [Thermoanaerobaculia bacterium]